MASSQNNMIPLKKKPIDNKPKINQDLSNLVITPIEVDNVQTK